MHEADLLISILFEFSRGFAVGEFAGSKRCAQHHRGQQEISSTDPVSTNRPARLAVTAALGALMTLAAAAQQAPPARLQCRPAGAPVRVKALPEGSGLAASRRTPGRFWSINDSGEPVVFALDANGRVTGRLTLPGATVDDWEAVAVGSCPSGSCLYVADIGDNNAHRQNITIYRVPEPDAATGPVEVTGVFHAAYPDRAHDAEALLVSEDGRLYIVTKGNTALYRFPRELQAGSTMQLERVGKPRAHAAKEKITDGAVSPDGRWIVLRTERALTFYRASDLLAGSWREAGRETLAALGEPQGEGVTFGTDDNSLYLMSEGGGRKRPGTFVRITCTLDP